MKYISILILAYSLVLFPLIAPAAEHGAEMRISELKQAELKEAKKKKVDNLEKRFCCKTDGGTPCYVFGDASCTNCTGFCSGNMIIGPADAMSR